MSERPRTRTTEADADASAEADLAAMPPPETDAPPTLREAFTVLCRALEPHLQDDMPRWMHCQTIQGWLQDAGEDASGQAQEALAWTHAVALLEGVLGRPLLQR